MALEVAEGAVVRDDLEAVADRLEPAPGAMAAVGSLADEVGEHRGALVGWQDADRRPGLLLGRRARLEHERGQQVVLVALHRQQPDRRRRALVRARAVEPEPRGPALGRLAPLGEVVDPRAAALGLVHPRHEARHHLLQLGEDHLAVGARLRERRAEQPQQQLLVGLAGGEYAHVRQRRGGQQAAQQVERLCADRALVRGLGLAVGAREALVGPCLDERQALRVGVEEVVHRGLVVGPERGVAPVAVAALGHRRVVGDVASRLL